MRCMRVACWGSGARRNLRPGWSGWGSRIHAEIWPERVRSASCCRGERVAGITGPEKNAPDVWARLRRFTPARIGLGRVGGSVPTRALLDFELAHARARDAVHARFDASALADELRGAGFGEVLVVSSQARDRMEYLLRPDLGRALDAESLEKLRESRGSACGLGL